MCSYIHRHNQYSNYHSVLVIAAAAFTAAASATSICIKWSFSLSPRIHCVNFNESVNNPLLWEYISWFSLICGFACWKLEDLIHGHYNHVYIIKRASNGGKINNKEIDNIKCFIKSSKWHWYVTMAIVRRAYLSQSCHIMKCEIKNMYNGTLSVLWGTDVRRG